MAYTKTQWVDNTTSIDKDNLNKIEQGIYDNSLVVDAITNTLNPTDTETYKTAELTEGQITDVIGVSDIVIKGQTSQDGTPTPDPPVVVNVVSGSNVVNTSNKNLYDSSYRKADGTITVRGIATEENGVFWLTATGTDAYIWQITTEGTSYSESSGKLYEFKENTYSVFITNNQINTNLVTYYDENKISLGYSNKISSSFTINKTDKSGAKYFSIRFGRNTAVVNTTYNFSVQLQKGSTATTYEPHQGKELPLDLGSIELCKIGDYQDYFYKSGSKWYLHKEIGKIVLDGSEEWSFINNCLQSTNELPNNISTIDTNLNALSDYFVYHYYPTGITTNIQVGEFGWNSSKKITFKIENLTTKQAYLDWLDSNNVTVYYPLQIATDTEITDTTLISQLEAIYNAPLYEQTNITQANNDLPMVLDITACKDNINGIKAFIRK